MKKREEKKEPSLVAELSIKEFESALNTQLVLVNSTNRDMLKNSYGEIKDIRVTRDLRTKLNLILLDEENLKSLYAKKAIDTRLVLHACLQVAKLL